MCCPAGHSRIRCAIKTKSGFTLIEIAVVLVIFGIIATAALRVSTGLLNSASYRDTRQKMAVVKEALIGYLRTNNRLPCPDTKAGFLNAPSPGAIAFLLAAPPDGIENRNQTSGALDTKLACDSRFGVLPYATLGLSAETATDGFGNYFSYYLSNGYGWSSSNAGAQSSMSGTITVQDKDLSASGRTDVVVVVLSYGANGFGAWTRKGTQISAAPAGADEQANISPDNVTGNFVTRSVSDDPTSAGGAFDDVVMALSANELVGGLLSEKSQQSLNSKVLTAKQDIAAIEAAIAAFVVSTGRYPAAATATNNDGLEVAGTYKGDVPWSTLGVSRFDPWFSTYQYAVSPVLTSSLTLTTGASIDLAAANTSVTFNNSAGQLLTKGLVPGQTIAVSAASGGRALNAGLTGFISAVSASSLTVAVANRYGGGSYSNWLLTAKAFPASLTLQEGATPSSGTAPSVIVPFVVYSLGQNNSRFFVDGSQTAQPCMSAIATAQPIPPLAPACLGMDENFSRDGTPGLPFVRASINIPTGTTGDARLYYDDVVDYLPKAVIDAKMP